MSHFIATIKSPIVIVSGLWAAAVETTSNVAPVSTLIIGACATVAITLGKYAIDKYFDYLKAKEAKQEAE